MKRIGFIGLVLIMASLLSGVVASSAAANACEESTEKVGNYSRRTPDTNAGLCEVPVARGSGEYVITTGKGVHIAPNTECAKVSETEAGNYKDTKCTEKVEAGKGEYIKINEEPVVGEGQWYKCVNRGLNKGKFENNQCVKEGGNKEWELELLKELLKIVVKQVTPFKLVGKVSGITLEIECTKLKGTGSIHNGKVKKDLPVGTTEEVLTGLGLINSEFETCLVPRPVGQECKVAQPIVVPSVIQLSIVGTTMYTLFSPDPTKSSTIFVEITFSGCKQSALNGTFKIEGMAAGSVKNSTSTLTFTAGAPNNKLFFAGNEAEFTGESLMEMEGGGFVNAH